MKTVKYYHWFICGVTAIPTLAQNSPAIGREIPVDSLAITCSKTSSLIFEQPIISVDRGDRKVLAQKAKGVDNVLQVKAAEACFEPSSLTVVTADGLLFPFVVTYDHDPKAMNRYISGQQRTKAQLTVLSQNHYLMQQYSKLVRQDQRVLRGISTREYDLELAVEGIFLQGPLLFFKISVSNHSRIDYDLEPLRFFIRDKKTVKRTAIQEIEINPLHELKDLESIAPGGTAHLIYAVEKFTIPDKQVLAVNLLEKGGSRHLQVLVKQSKFRKVLTLPKL